MGALEATTRTRVKPAARPNKSIVFVGLMGAGKTSVGRMVAERLGLEFVDADSEIEAAASATIEEIFETFGEATFRSGERRVIARLLKGPVRVIATGGGAFMDPATRRQVRDSAVSVWLKADLPTLLKRVSRRGGRPLLKGSDTRATLARLMAERDPVYAEADVTVETSDNPPAEVADRVIAALERHLGIALLAPAHEAANATRAPGKARTTPPGTKGPRRRGPLQRRRHINATGRNRGVKP